MNTRLIVKTIHGLHEHAFTGSIAIGFEAIVEAIGRHEALFVIAAAAMTVLLGIKVFARRRRTRLVRIAQLERYCEVMNGELYG